MKSKRLTLQIVRRVIFILLFLAAYVVQYVFIPRTSFPFPVFILIGLLTSVSMFEHEFSALFFGLLAGALWDLASPVTDGLLALILSFSACLIGLLCHYLVRNTLLCAVIFSSALSLLFSAVMLLYFVSPLTVEGIRQTFTATYLPGCCATLVTTVPTYLLVRKIRLATEERK